MPAHLQLLQLTLGDPAELKDQAAGGGGLARVHMAADDDGKVPAQCQRMHQSVELRWGACRGASGQRHGMTVPLAAEAAMAATHALPSAIVPSWFYRSVRELKRTGAGRAASTKHVARDPEWAH